MSIVQYNTGMDRWREWLTKTQPQLYKACWQKRCHCTCIIIQKWKKSLNMSLGFCSMKHVYWVDQFLSKSSQMWNMIECKSASSGFSQQSLPDNWVVNLLHGKGPWLVLRNDKTKSATVYGRAAGTSFSTNCLVYSLTLLSFLFFFFRVWDRRRTMLVAKHQVIPEGPWTGRERCSQPTRSSQDELDFF